MQLSSMIGSTNGIVEALTAAIDESGMSRSAVQRVMIGTTHFTNAVIQRRGLLRTGIIQLGYPTTQMLPPFVDWPADVRDAVQGTGVILPGWFEYDGREIARLDAAQVRGAVRELRRAGIEAIAVSSVFSLIDDAHERETAAIIRRDKEIVAMVPDLISLVDEATGEPVSTEIVRYGLRVVVVGIPAPVALTTPGVLRVVGPAAFGYDVPFRPLPGRYGGRELRVW